MRTAPATQQGQSLTELALTMPIVLSLALIAGNVGMALRAHISLTQATQQATQLLLHHPEATSAAYAADVATYLSNHGLSNAVVTVMPNAGSDSSDPKLELQVTVEYDFPVIAPVADSMSLGPLHHGALHLYASSSTIAATEPPSNLTSSSTNSLCPGSNYLTWSAPPTLSTPAPSLIYQVSSFGQLIATVTPPASLSYCDNSGTTPSTTSSYYNYTVVAVQSNGLASPAAELRAGG